MCGRSFDLLLNNGEGARREQGIRSIRRIRHGILTEDTTEPRDLRGRFHVLRIHPLEFLHIVEDLGELPAELLYLILPDREPCELGDMPDLGRGDLEHVQWKTERGGTEYTGISIQYAGTLSPCILPIAMELQHLRGRKVNQRVLMKGRLWRGKTMTIRWMPGVPLSLKQRPKERAPQGIYVGTFAPLTLDKRAVYRNRMRRRCREALRVTVRGERELPTVQLLLSPRSSSLSCDFGDILADVRIFLSILRSWDPPPSAAASSSSR